MFPSKRLARGMAIGNELSTIGRGIVDARYINAERVWLSYHGIVAKKHRGAIWFRPLNLNRHNVAFYRVYRSPILGPPLDPEAFAAES